MYVWMKFPIQDYMSSRSSTPVNSSYSSLGDLKGRGKVTDNPKATCLVHFLIRKITGNLPICPVACFLFNLPSTDFCSLYTGIGVYMACPV